MALNGAMVEHITLVLTATLRTTLMTERQANLNTGGGITCDTKVEYRQGSEWTVVQRCYNSTFTCM